jgi:hypothetical protein
VEALEVGNALVASSTLEVAVGEGGHLAILSFQNDEHIWWEWEAGTIEIEWRAQSQI